MDIAWTIDTDGNDTYSIAGRHFGPTDLPMPYKYRVKEWSFENDDESKDDEGHEEIVFAGRASERCIDPVLEMWDVTAACLSRCRLLVGVDSALHHLAAAVGTPAVVVFGCSRPDVVAVPGMHAVWAEDLECAGCLQSAPPTTCRVHCQRPSIDCLDRITVESVLAKIKEVLS